MEEKNVLLKKLEEMESFKFKSDDPVNDAMRYDKMISELGDQLLKLHDVKYTERHIFEPRSSNDYRERNLSKLKDSVAGLTVKKFQKPKTVDEYMYEFADVLGSELGLAYIDYKRTSDNSPMKLRLANDIKTMCDTWSEANARESRNDYKTYDWLKDINLENEACVKACVIEYWYIELEADNGNINAIDIYYDLCKLIRLTKFSVGERSALVKLINKRNDYSDLSILEQQNVRRGVERMAKTMKELNEKKSQAVKNADKKRKAYIKWTNEFENDREHTMYKSC